MFFKQGLDFFLHILRDCNNYNSIEFSTLTLPHISYHIRLSRFNFNRNSLFLIDGYYVNSFSCTYFHFIQNSISLFFIVLFSFLTRISKNLASPLPL